MNDPEWMYVGAVGETPVAVPWGDRVCRILYGVSLLVGVWAAVISWQEVLTWLVALVSPSVLVPEPWVAWLVGVGVGGSMLLVVGFVGWVAVLDGVMGTVREQRRCQ